MNNFWTKKREARNLEVAVLSVNRLTVEQIAYLAYQMDLWLQEIAKEEDEDDQIKLLP